MKLSAQKLYYLLVASVCSGLVLLLLGAYGANSFLKSKSSIVRDARLQVMVLEEKQKQLSKARADIQVYQTQADIARHIVPQDKDQAQTVREIVSIADQYGIKLGSITFPSSTLGDAKVKNSQLQPVKNIPGVLSLEINVQSASNSPTTYAVFIDFLDALEHNRRTALVKGITLLPDTAHPGKLTFTLVLNEYVKP